MYSASPIKKCNIRDCVGVGLFSVDSLLYCIEHVKIHVLTPTRHEHKSLKLCANGDCENRGRIRCDGRLYCTNYAIVQYYNSSTNTTRYTKCSDVEYITCMHEDCWTIPCRILSNGVYRGYYCIRHYDMLSKYKNDTSISQYIPTSDDWIEYALENVTFNV